jgi:hypothetical protein
MASSSTHKKSEHVPDSELLDYDDVDFQINPAEIDNLGAQTPRTGKKIRMNSPPPRSPSSSSNLSSRTTSPHRTPPRHLPNPESSSRISCQTNILIHTNEKCSLQLITTASYKTDLYFHTLKSAMDNLITRAEMTLMQQEPFHTLLSQGYTFNISQPQLSYKTKDLAADEIMDYIVDMSKLTSGRNRTAIPHLTTTSGNTQIANVDISFKFHVQPFTGVRKSRLADQATNTYDAASINPIIDLIRDKASSLTSLQRSEHSLGTKISPRLPQPKTQPTASKRPRSPSAVRPHDRLGPPVPHAFNRRQRSRDGFRKRIQGPRGHGRGRHE